MQWRCRIGVLRVEAEASTDTRPLPGFTPRKGAGFPLLGKSKTDPPERRNTRIDFQFDRAAFKFKALPFSVPYPVPFKLLGDETKGAAAVLLRWVRRVDCATAMQHCQTCCRPFSGYVSQSVLSMLQCDVQGG